MTTKDRERTVDVVHREYVLSLEAALSEAYRIMTMRTGGQYQGNEIKTRLLLERIENLLWRSGN